ncbi:MAG: hypothetical protein RL156_676, partial [Bacteroidota bacterium]
MQTRALRLVLLILWLAPHWLQASGDRCRVRILHSTVSELAITASPKIIRWDTVAASDGTKEQVFRPVMNTTGETALSDVPNAEALSAVRELISVSNRGMWRVRSFRMFGRRYDQGGTSSAFVSQSSGSMGLDKWTSTDTNVLLPWISIQYLGQSAAQHLAVMVIPSAQREKSTGAWLVCDSVFVTVEFGGSSSNSSNNSTGSPDGSFNTSIIAHQSAAAGSYTPLMSSTLNNNVVPLWNAAAEQLSKGSSSQTSTRVSTSSGKFSKNPRLMADSSRQSVWYKVAIKESGVYKITADQLSKAGITLSPAQVATLKLYGRGGDELPELPSQASQNTLNEIPLIVGTNSDGSFRDLSFYGSAPGRFAYNSKSKRFEHSINNYGDQSSYFLTWGGTPGTRAVAQSAPSAPFSYTPNTFTARVYQEEELINAYAGGSGRRWFGQQIDAVLPRTFATKLPGLVRDGKVEYVLDVAHKEIFSSLSNAIVTVSDNSTKLADIALLGVNSSSYAEYVSRKVLAAIPAQSLNQDGTSYLRFEYSNPYVSGGGNAFLDYFEIHYPAVCAAVNDELTVYTDPAMVGSAQYSVSGFTTTS